VSIHVHGVHYKADSDGTMKVLNGPKDEAAFPGRPYTYKWTAAPGTAGTWPDFRNSTSVLPISAPPGFVTH